jgi:hypothetical protein
MKFKKKWQNLKEKILTHQILMVDLLVFTINLNISENYLSSVVSAKFVTK